MVDIIHLNDDPHAQTQLLLPWYVNGTLKDEDAAQVRKHVSQCAECRQDLEMETALAGHIQALPGDAERGWAAPKARVEGARPSSRKAALFSRPIPVKWALLAQAASIAILVSLTLIGSTRPTPLYRTPVSYTHLTLPTIYSV